MAARLAGARLLVWSHVGELGLHLAHAGIEQVLPEAAQVGEGERLLDVVGGKRREIRVAQERERLGSGRLGREEGIGGGLAGARGNRSGHQQQGGGGGQEEGDAIVHGRPLGGWWGRE